MVSFEISSEHISIDHNCIVHINISFLIQENTDFSWKEGFLNFFQGIFRFYLYTQTLNDLDCLRHLQDLTNPITCQIDLCYFEFE